MGVGRRQLSMLTNMNLYTHTLKSHVGQSQDWSTRNFNEQIIKIMLRRQMINTGRGAMKVYLVSSNDFSCDRDKYYFMYIWSSAQP